MGGCASKPKELDSHAASPLSSDSPHPQATAQSNTNRGVSQVEKSKQEAEKEAQLSSSSEVVSAETDVPKTENPTENNDDRATKGNNEDKVEDITKEPAKEAEAAEHKPNDVPPSKEEAKSDARLADL